MRTREASEAMPSKTAYRPAAASKPAYKPPSMAWLKGTATPKPPPMAWVKGTETRKPPSMAWLKGTAGPAAPTKPTSQFNLFTWLKNAAQKLASAFPQYYQSAPTPGAGYTYSQPAQLAQAWMKNEARKPFNSYTPANIARLFEANYPKANQYNFTPGSMAALLPYEYPKGIMVSKQPKAEDFGRGPGKASNMSWDETPPLTDNTGGVGTGGYYDWWPYPSGDYSSAPYPANIPSWLYGNIYWRGW